MNVSDLVDTISVWMTEFAWAVQLFVVVLAALVAGTIARRVVLHLRERTRETHNVVDDALLEALIGPTRGMILVIGLSWAAYIAGQETDAAIFDAVPAMRDLLVVTMLTW